MYMLCQYNICVIYNINVITDCFVTETIQASTVYVTFICLYIVTCFLIGFCMSLPISLSLSVSLSLLTTNLLIN